MIENVGVFRWGQPPIERHHHRAEFRAGENQDDHFRAIGAEKRHTVATSDRQMLLQARGQAGGTLVEGSVGNCLAVANKRRLVRCEARPAADP